MKRIIPCLFILLTSLAVFAQEQSGTTSSQQQTTPNVKSTPADVFEAQIIPRNSRVYIAPFKSEDSEKPVEGFETYMAAAIRKKNVPLIMVNDRSQADFEIVGSADKKGRGD